MNQIRSLALTLIWLALLLSSCQKAPFVTMTGPRSFTFTQEGGTQTFSFSCNRDWSVSSSENWIRVSPSSGTASDGEITVSIMCSPNTTYDSRTAVLTVNVEELMENITIMQDTGLGLIVSPATYDLTNAEQIIEVEVQHNVNYIIEIDDACENWIKKGDTKSLSTDKVTFHVAANTTYDDREGKITFKQKDGPLSGTLVIKQEKSTYLNVQYTEMVISFLDKEYEIAVEANEDFTCSSNEAWLSCVAKNDYSGVIFKAAKNETSQQRAGNITISLIDKSITKTVCIKQNPKEKGVYYNSNYGNLDKELNNYQRDTITHMVVMGVLNNEDFNTINSLPSLIFLDIRDCEIDGSIIPVNAFKDNGTIKSIKLPESITLIGYGSFDGAYRLVELNIPDNVVTISDYAFNKCIALKDLSISNQSKLQAISSHAFERNEALESINLPPGLESIEHRAFYKCANLYDFSLPQNVKSIGVEAFAGCLSLESIIIPEKVSSILSSTFYDCSSLRTVQLPDGLEIIEDTAFYGCKSLVSINIPETTRFGRMSFKDCISLPGIHIPEGVTSIPWYCFENCTFTEVVLPSTVNSISRGFRGCTKLSRITSLASIPPSIDEFSFSNYTTATVYVKSEDLTGYKNSAWGTLFGDRIEAIE